MAGRSIFKDLTPYFFYLLLTATLGPLLFGYHLAELNAPQEVITCAKKSVGGASVLSRIAATLQDEAKTAASSGPFPQCIRMNSTQFGLVSSFFTLGGLIGALSGGPVTTKYGRLASMIMAAVFAAVGPVFEATATNIGLFTVGRFIAGLGAGAATVIVPIYISEIAPPHQKGFFGSFTQVMINVGILIAQILGLFLSKGQLWRIILAVGGAIAVAQGVGLLLAGQESPKWMADNGRPSRAKRILRKVRGHAADIEEEVAGWGCESERDLDDEEETLLANEDHMHEHPAENDNDDDNNNNGGRHNNESTGEEIRREASEAGKKAGSSAVGVFTVLTNPDYRPAVFAVAMIMIGQQLCGVNSIVMYGVSLLSNLLAANSALLNVAVAALNVVITLGAAPLVDKLGRKACLLISITGMGTSSILLAVGIMKSISILAAVAVITFITSFGIGLGPVPFILSSELVGAEAVGATQSWALAANWIATFLVAQFFPLINEKLGDGQVYFIFAGFAVFFGGFTAWYVPETKGKTDAEEVWGRKKAHDRED